MVQLKAIQRGRCISGSDKGTDEDANKGSNKGTNEIIDKCAK
jgi:hypothetical protein